MPRVEDEPLGARGAPGVLGRLADPALPLDQAAAEGCVKGDVPARLLQCAERLRRRCSVRQVSGSRYPVPLGEFYQWEEELVQMRRARGHVPKQGAQFHARKIFRRSA